MEEPSFIRTPGSRVCFLDLPLNIRKRILAPEVPYQLHHDTGRHVPPYHYLHDWGRRCECCRDLWQDKQLLLVSRPVSRDYSATILEIVHWEIRLDEDSGGLLSRLPRGFEPAFWGCFAALTVRLSLRPRVPADQEDPAPAGEDGVKCDIAADDTSGDLSPIVERMVSDWAYICEQLAAHSTEPGRLSLYLICDPEDMATAKAIVRPMSSLPVLKACGIQLRQVAHFEAQSLARRTLDRCMSRRDNDTHNTPTGFRFMALPTEIQLQILGYTDLVASRVRTIGFGFCYSNCSPQGVKSCFCPFACAASSSSCSCTDYPRELFLVNRKMHDLATCVFFSKNTFYFSSERRSVPRPARYLSRFTPEALKHIRVLYFHFPQVPLDDEVYPWRNEWVEWARSVDFIASNMDLSKFTIAMRYNWSGRSRRFRRLPLYPVPNPSGARRKAWAYGDPAIKPMAALKGLKDLFVFGDENFGPEIPIDERRETDVLLEKFVMGNDYDSWGRGKAELIRTIYRDLYGPLQGYFTGEEDLWSEPPFSECE